jgi:tetratricopeptide (TPR) repeat protein
VETVRGSLDIAGFEPWMDRHNLEPGDRWDAEIRTGLARADVLCVFLSNNGQTGRDRYFRREYLLGLEVMSARELDRSTVVPVRLDSCEVPPELQEFQIVTLVEEGGLERLETGLRKAARRLGKIVEPRFAWHLERCRKHLARGELSQALLEAEDAIDLEPNDGDIRLCRAEIYVAERRYVHAMADLEVGANAGADVFLVACLKAAALRGLDRIDDSVSAAGRAIDARPADPNGYLERAKSLEQKRWIDLALEDYYHVVSLDARNAEAHAGRGRCLSERQEDVEALAAFDQAVALDADNGAYLYQRGRAAGSAAQFAGLEDGYQRAMADLNAAIQRDPQNGLYLAERGWIAWNTHDAAQAQADLDLAVQLAPFDARVFFTRGIMLRAAGSPDRAIEALDTAVKLDPRDPENHAARGTVLRVNGRAREAIADFTAAITLQPQSLRYYKMRGDSYQDLDDLQSALDDYQRWAGHTPSRRAV